MKVYILIFVMNGLLMHTKFNSYQDCELASKSLGTKTICIETTDMSTVADIYPDLTK